MATTVGIHFRYLMFLCHQLPVSVFCFVSSTICTRMSSVDIILSNKLRCLDKKFIKTLIQINFIKEFVNLYLLYG